MTLLILVPLMSSLQASVSYNSTVHPRKIGSMCTVIPFEGWVVIIWDPIDDNVISHFPKKKLPLSREDNGDFDPISLRVRRREP
jgi:hypothetical protein